MAGRSNVYPEKLAAAGRCNISVRTEEEREEINRIIMDELVNGIFKSEAITFFQKVIGRLKAEGCRAIILGCTEIP